LTDAGQDSATSTENTDNGRLSLFQNETIACMKKKEVMKLERTLSKLRANQKNRIWLTSNRELLDETRKTETAWVELNTFSAILPSRKRDE